MKSKIQAILSTQPQKCFFTGMIVRGKICGIFEILGFRNDLGSEIYAQLKTFDPDLQEYGYGELALPLSAIKQYIAC